MAVALGEAYLSGDKGYPQNTVAAWKWFRVAAQAGDPRAMAKYGLMLGMGSRTLP